MAEKEKKSFAKRFFEGLTEEKNDATSVKKHEPTSDEVVMSQKRKKLVDDTNKANAELEGRAQRLEEHANNLREGAKNGVAPKGESNEGKPISKQRANDLIHGYEGAEDWEDVAAQQRAFKTAPNPKDPSKPFNSIDKWKNESKRRGFSAKEFFKGVE